MQLATIIIALLLAVTAAAAQDLVPSDIEGLKIDASVTMAMRTRNSGREHSGQTLHQWNFELGPDKAINGRFVRTYSSGGTVRGKREARIVAKISIPQQHQEGNAVWALEQNTLVRLSTTPVGGWKLTIEFSKTDNRWTCKASYARFQELGKGHSRNLGVEQGAQGQVIEILSASQIKSSCLVGH